jgi:hypothetical protein
MTLSRLVQMPERGLVENSKLCRAITAAYLTQGFFARADEVLETLDRQF